MSIRAVDWALRESPVSDPFAKLVLVGIANHATDEGTNAYPSRKTLAVYAACSVRTVQNKLNDLMAAGVITQGDQEIVSHFRSDRRPIVYDINFDVQLLHPAPQPDDVQLLHPADAPEDGLRGAAHDTTGCSSRHNGVQLSAHNTSFKPSIKPSMDNHAVDDDIHLVSGDGFSAQTRAPRSGKLHAVVDSSPPDITGARTFIRDGVEVSPALSLAPGVVLPKRNGWQPSEAAMLNARSIVTITDISLHVARYEIIKAEKREKPSDSEWLRWLIQDERQARAEALRHESQSRQSRPWHGVAD